MQIIDNVMLCGASNLLEMVTIGSTEENHTQHIKEKNTLHKS